jgi:hypothetical protein
MVKQTKAKANPVRLPAKELRPGAHKRRLATDSSLAMRFNRPADTRIDVRLKHRGAWAEAAACAWLFTCGFEVFRNCSAHGTADFIAYNPLTNELHLIDVKMTYRRGVSLTLKQFKAGVTILSVDRWGKCEFLERKISYPDQRRAAE